MPRKKGLSPEEIEAALQTAAQLLTGGASIAGPVQSAQAQSGIEGESQDPVSTNAEGGEEGGGFPDQAVKNVRHGPAVSDLEQVLETIALHGEKEADQIRATAQLHRMREARAAGSSVGQWTRHQIQSAIAEARAELGLPPLTH